MQLNMYFCTEIDAYLMKIMKYQALLCVFFALLTSCGGQKEERVVAPWGEVGTPDSLWETDNFDLEQIQFGGEMIMLTVSGPMTYYDHRGRQLGVQYMMAQKFADKLGVRLRVDICRDTTEMLEKLIQGDGDLIAVPLADSISSDVLFCGPGSDSLHIHWAVNRDKPHLARELSEWYKPSMLAEVRKEEEFLLSSRSVKRRVFSPMLNRSAGIISHYDGLFMQYCQSIRWDWRLMAAQCYQESTFDPKATSWAGAKGLMQIMPRTADALGLSRDKMYDPESSIAAAAKLLGQLEGKFSDIADRYERTNFVLASYNGGYHHVRDAMALCQRDGKNPHRWDDVSEYILKLAQPQYYQDPIVKHGYMRGSETEGYVRKIRERWQSYRGVKSPRTGFHATPQKAKRERKKKYDV